MISSVSSRDQSSRSSPKTLRCARRIFNAALVNVFHLVKEQGGGGGGLDETLLLMIDILHLESPRCDLHRRYKL